ncbi:MAG: aldo/keto reductase [Kiritimatiellae bacterium]|nr:aldo/keto reductase [Kiritimatiellia bacterium]
MVSPPVPRRRFGRTELAMPVFSCGGMRYQHSWSDKAAAEIPSDSQTTVEAVVQRAYEFGITHFETARGYGTSEMQLGRALKNLPRDELIVQTKIGPRANGAEFREVFETSLANLKMDHVELLSIHGLNTPELLAQCLTPGGALDAAEKLRREGRCRFIGFSTHGPVDFILDAINTGRFDYVNIHWYFVNDFTWPAVEAAAKQDMGVFIISPNDKGGKLYEPSEKLTRLCAPLSPMQFNDLYCLSRPQVHTLSIGANKPSDFDEHVAALARYDTRVEITAPIARRLNDEMESVLGRDWVRHWFEGLPKWSDVPGEINIHEILRLWNFAIALDMEAFAKMRYGLLGQGDHWQPGQNAAEADSLDLADALKKSPFADRIPEILREAHASLFEGPKQRISES